MPLLRKIDSKPRGGASLARARLAPALLAPALLALTLVGPVAPLLSAPALGQNYLADEVDRRLSSRGATMKRYAKLPSGEDPGLMEYMTKFYFPMMTQPDPDGLEELGKLRYELFRSLIGPASPELQRRLSDEALRFAKRVVSNSKYHPAVRYNALLVLGQIDKIYTADNSQELPTPDPEANQLLCAVAQKAASDARLPRMMLVGALVGLDRHAGLLDKLPQANQAATIKCLGSVLVKDDLAGEYAPGVKDWVYYQAARGLARTGSAGPRGAYMLAIGKRIADKKIDREVRAELAALLAELKPQPGQVKADPVLDAVEALAVEIAKAESKSAKMFQDLNLGGGVRMASVSGGREKTSRRFHEGEEVGRIELERSGLTEVLTNVAQGLAAVTPLAEPARQEKLQLIAGAYKAARASAIDKNELDLDVASALQTMADAVERATGVEEPAVDPAEGF